MVAGICYVNVKDTSRSLGALTLYYTSCYPSTVLSIHDVPRSAAS